MWLTPMQDLGKCCSERLDSLRTWIGLATLRIVQAGAVPEEFQAEPMSCEFLIDLPMKAFANDPHDSSYHSRFVSATIAIRAGSF
jgi:hypothetical protein